ncbi:MAG: hypothetical protein HY908_26975 [Myxococcales bacterium]|nr:hypothetical protein [Myxococcales bacterium]
MIPRRLALPLVALASLAALGGACGGDESTGPGGGGGAIDPAEFALVERSCGYLCPPDPTCSEHTVPYQCQNLGAWSAVPHAAACQAWDGTFPAPVAGQCSASEPTGEAIKLTGVDPDDPDVRIMPDGRRLTPVGTEHVFPDLASQTNNVVGVPGTGLVLVLDLGNWDHIVRVVDPALVGSGDPTLGQVSFPRPEALNQGIAFSAPDRVFVATAQGVVQALTIDTASGSLARDDAHNITLPASPDSPGGVYYGSGVAVSADGARLFASGVKDPLFVVVDAAAASPTYGAVLGQVSLGAIESFNVYVDPHDPATSRVYATMWASHAVREIDVSDPAAPVVTRTFQVEKNPQGMAFLDARWAVVGNDLGDSLSLLDRTSGAVTTIAVDASAGLLGREPSSLAWDETSHRLWVTEAGYNALAAYDVDLAQTPPTLTPAGRLPTAWWPSGVAVLGDGSLVVTTIRGQGIGPRDPSASYDLLRGSIQHIPAPSPADLVAGEAQAEADVAVAAQPGSSVVVCPPGVDDFPVPATNTAGPSQRIDRVVVVLRENKTFDGLFGDLPGVRGDPSLTNVPAAEMDGIWGNVRELARTFAHSDNFYTSAFLSTQGHLWATYGRTDDFNEREWPVTGYGRGLRGDGDSGGVADVARPAEGSMFDWLGQNGVPYDILGEIVGSPVDAHFDVRYPGGFIQSMGYPDVEKACYVAGRARIACDLGKFVFMTLPNDHTIGVSPTTPTPESMFAVNDEATGMVVDALSHDPAWARTLVMVIEDDPGMGGESVDYHRTILVMASPWLKRGYVSHQHIDIASVHKLVAHLFGLPYPNLQVANAALPLDMFTATPDYAPYEYLPRSYPLSCGTTATQAEHELTRSWDLADPDAQPGIDEQVMRWLRREQWTALPPEVEADIERRQAARAARQTDH